jgi:hypothetical protein
MKHLRPSITIALITLVLFLFGNITNVHANCGTIYASPTGSVLGNGTENNPVDIITAFHQACTQNKKQIRLISGVYNINQKLIIDCNDLSIDGDWQIIGGNAVKNTSLTTTININSLLETSAFDGLSGTMVGYYIGIEAIGKNNFKINDLVINVKNGGNSGLASGTTGNRGNSVYGLYFRNSNGWTLESTIVNTGEGSKGSDGTNGADGVTGLAGEQGGIGHCNEDCLNGSTQRFGGKGGNGGGGTLGGALKTHIGSCQTVGQDGNSGATGSGRNGGGGGSGATGGSEDRRGGFGGNGGSGAGGSGATTGGQASFSGNGTNGSGNCTNVNAGNGGNGVNGNNGADGVTSATSNTFAFFWLPNGQGNNGTDGTGGGGGKGGGGGGGQGCFFCADGTGSSGGGGGGGGQGGAGGTGGWGGGGSFSVYLNASIGSLIYTNLNSTSSNNGGIGRNGGTGGTGGNGGAKGVVDFSACLSCEVGIGGDGGKGGNGGNGGKGANGTSGRSDTLTLVNGASLAVQAVPLINSCGPYTWVDGITYTQNNNTATYIVSNSAGCDSTARLNLVISNSNLTEQSFSVSNTSICSGDSAQITLNNSQVGVKYFLRNDADNSIVDGSVFGTRSSIPLNTGIVNNTTTYNIYAESPNSAALQFTGNAGLKKVSLGTSMWNNEFAGNNQLTIETWVKRSTSDNLQTIISNYQTITTTPYEFLFRIDNNKIRLFLNSTLVTQSTSDIPVGTWTHLAATYDGASVKIYVNGVLEITSSFTGNLNSASYDLKIGGGLTNNTEYYSGDIGEVRLWKVARTASDIAANYQKQLFGNENGLVGYYKFNDGSGNIAYNSASNGLYDGTLVNNPAWVSGPSISYLSCDLEFSQKSTITINNSATTDVISACNSYTWINGITYTESNNTAKDTLTNTAGCDSIVSLDLTITKISSQTFNTSISEFCNSDSSQITLDNSEAGVHYYLRNDADNSIVDGPVFGTRNSISLNTGNIDTTTTYNVYAELPNSAALQFTGNAGLKKVSLGTSMWNTEFAGTSNLTVEAWVKRSTAGNLQTIIGNYEGAYPFLFRLHSEKIMMYVNSGPFIESNATIPVGTWVHLAATYNGSELKIYINGVLDKTSAYSTPFISSTNEMKIGGGLNNNTEFFPGDISEVRLWKVARTASEIAANYQKQLTGSENGLVAYYKFNEGSGTTTYNSAANGLYDGTLVNAPAWVSGTSITSLNCEIEFPQKVTITDMNPITSTDVIVTCDSITWIDGITYYASNNIATHTLLSAAGCDSIVSLDLTILNFSSQNFTTSQTNVSCNGGSDGSATVSVSGGTAPYTYSWSPSGATTATATGLSPGYNTVTVKDANLCEATYIFTITHPSQLSTSAQNQTNVSCNGGSDGSATVSVSGGTHPYTYSWSPSGGTAATATGLSPGYNTVTVTDANLCETTRVFTITHPSQLVATAGNQVNVGCNETNTGSATVSVSGGTHPYTYSWSPSGGNNETATGLAPGEYTVTVIDAKLCQTTKDFTITGVDAPIITADDSETICLGGSIILTPSVNEATTTGFIGDFAASNWTQSSSNSDGSIVFSETNVVMTSSNNGSFGSGFNQSIITIPYNTTISFNWLYTTFDGAQFDYPQLYLNGNIQIFNGYSTSSGQNQSGTYTIELQAGDQFGLRIVTTDNSGGSATVTITNFQAASNQYAWVASNGGIINGASDTPTLDVDTAGTYTLTVTNAEGCSASKSIEVIVNNPPTTTDVITACDSITWIDGITYTASNNVATHTLVNAAGCDSIVSLDLTILNFSNQNFTTSQTNVSCNGGSDGSATVTVSGGTAPYTYSWSPSGATTATATGLSPGYNTVTVKDSNLCEAIHVFTITHPTEINLTLASQTNNACIGGTGGAATINAATGGAGGYTYDWEPGNPTGDGTLSVSGLSSQTYTVTATDINSCSTSISVNILEPGSSIVWGSGAADPQADANGRFANPFNTANSWQAVSIFDAVGTPGNALWTRNLTGLSQGAYSTGSNPMGSPTQADGIAIFDGDFMDNGGTPGGFGLGTSASPHGGELISPSIDLSAYANQLVTAEFYLYLRNYNITQFLLGYSNDGGATWTDINIMPSVSTNDFFPTTKVSYPLTNLTSVPDLTNCKLRFRCLVDYYFIMIDDLSLSVEASDPLSASISSQSNVSCFGGSNAEMTVTITGGTSNYNYSWSNGANTSNTSSLSNTITGLEEGNYMVTVTDANSCQATANATITQPASVNTSDVITACDSITWIDGVTYYANNNVATHTLVNAAGCDSIVTLDLTITNSTSNTTTVSTCGAYTWSVNGQTYTTSDTYTEVTGCHTEELVLTISNCIGWLGTEDSDWNNQNNWSSSTLPQITDSVIINETSNNPIISSLVEVKDVAINSGAELIVSSENSLSVTGLLTNNGTLTLKSGATLVQTSGSTTAGSGTYNVEQFLKGSGGATPNGRFYYMGTPVTGANTSVFNPEGNNRFWTHTEVTGLYTRIQDNATSLEAGGGYTIRMGADDTVVYSSNTLNNGNYTFANLSNTQARPKAERGIHLWSNPYPSHIDWGLINRTNIDLTYQLRTQNTSTNAMVFDTYNAISEVGTNNNGNGALTRYIAPFQAIWVRVNANIDEGTLALNNSMRSHQSGNVLKSNSDQEIIRLHLSNGSVYDETVIYMHANANNDLDAFDSQKMMDEHHQLFSLEAGSKLVLNGIENASVKESVQLGIKIDYSGNYSINANELNTMENVVLEDKKVNKLHDLKTNPRYNFTTTQGEDLNRFVLHFNKKADNVTNNNTALAQEEGVKIFSFNGNQVKVIIDDKAFENANINVYNMLGALVSSQKAESRENILTLDVATGIYMVELVSKDKLTTQKVMIK